MKEKLLKYIFLQTSLLLLNTNLFAQSLSHPHIWVNNNDKSAILDKIDTHSWATNLFNQYKKRVDSKKDSHNKNPETIINSIPAIPGNRTEHRNILTLGYEAALLYWLTDDNDYAQLAADILFYYTERIAKISGNVEFLSPNDWLVQTREEYPKIGMIYDFVQPYLVQPGTTVYDKASKTHVEFNLTNAQTTFKKLADQVFSRGGLNSNHPVLEATGALYNILCIEEDATRADYLDKFMNGAKRQNGLYWMLEECAESGLWPESMGYSIGPHRIILQLMEIVDKYDPSLNIIENNISVVENALFFENFRFPDGSAMRFGDAHRNRLNSKAICERVLTIANRKGLSNIRDRAYSMLKSLYAKGGGFNPDVQTQSLEWYNPLYLLWAVNVDTDGAGEVNYASGFSVEYAGLAAQRNLNTSNTKEYGLMAYTGGACYVHSHLSGIDLELYGAGAVLGSGGGDVGARDRASDIFSNYYRIFAGHNTVIINGTSKGGAEKSWKTDGQLYMNTTQTIAAEPASFKQAISEQFTFSAQQLNDEINKAKQQRVLSIVRTGDKTGYYFDLFRSKSLTNNNFHDYVYHNLGDGVSFVDAKNKPIALSSKTERYESVRSDYKGKFVMFPGWHYFEDVKTSDKIDVEVKATFNLTKQGKRYMHMLMPGGKKREYTTCKGPATLEGQLGYTDDKTPIVTVRHFGEAWNAPFISIFEPTRNASGSVKSVNNLYYNGVVTGAKVVSLVDGKIITDYIISNDETKTIELPEHHISFSGRFGIVRRLSLTEEYEDVTLYIGEGGTLKYAELEISGDIDKKNIKTFNNIEKPSSTTKLRENIIKVYPNPSGGIFNVNIAEPCTYRVHNLIGELIQSGTATNSFALNLTDDKGSIYVLSIKTSNGTIMKKIIKN